MLLSPGNAATLIAGATGNKVAADGLELRLGTLCASGKIPTVCGDRGVHAPKWRESRGIWKTWSWQSVAVVKGWRACLFSRRQDGFINAKSECRMSIHRPIQAPWSASPPSLVLRSSLLLCSYPECCPRVYLRVAKPAYSRPRLTRVAKRRLNFLFPRMSSSFLHSISIYFSPGRMTTAYAQTWASLIHSVHVSV